MDSIIAGKWGNGAERKRRLEQAGYGYRQVQDEVNKVVEVRKSLVGVAERPLLPGFFAWKNMIIWLVILFCSTII